MTRRTALLALVAGLVLGAVLAGIFALAATPVERQAPTPGVTATAVVAEHINGLVTAKHTDGPRFFLTVVEEDGDTFEREVNPVVFDITPVGDYYSD